jgi:toxin ParE1/3/4
MRRVRIHVAASEEAAEAAAWYEKERPGLGTEFEQAIDAALDLLEEEIVPLVTVHGAAGARGVKRLLLRRFPYAVIVREAAAEVVVIAFAHSARRPGYWRDRLKSGT